MTTADQCAGVVMETIPPIMRFIRAEMRRHGAPGLSMPQFRALAFLRAAPGSSLSSVADHLGVTPSTASIITERLVRGGLITRVTDPIERRRVILTLTPEGERLVEQARVATRQKLAAFLENLPPQQLQAIEAGLEALGVAFKEIVR